MAGTLRAAFVAADAAGATLDDAAGRSEDISSFDSRDCGGGGWKTLTLGLSAECGEACRGCEGGEDAGGGAVKASCQGPREVLRNRRSAHPWYWLAPVVRLCPGRFDTSRLPRRGTRAQSR